MFMDQLNKVLLCAYGQLRQIINNSRRQNEVD